MAVNPIDLQTLYVQMPLVGKEQANTRLAVVHAQELQAQKILKEQEAKGHAVIAIDAMDDENLAVHQDQKERSNLSHHHSPGEKKEDQENVDIEKDEKFQDPDLGQHIDISG